MRLEACQNQETEGITFQLGLSDSMTPFIKRQRAARQGSKATAHCQQVRLLANYNYTLQFNILAKI